MEFKQYEAAHRKPFEDLFVNYFTQDLGAPFPEEVIRGQVVQSFVGLNDSRVAPIVLALEDGVPVGFIIFQIDSPGSDWNDRPGWGFIREIYVLPEWRNSGVGSALTRVAEHVLAESGAKQAYLTTEGPFEFWKKTNWDRTGETAPNGGEVLTKNLVEEGSLS